MLTAWVPAGQSARFCGKKNHHRRRNHKDSQQLNDLFSPHQPHPLSGGIANRRM